MTTWGWLTAILVPVALAGGMVTGTIIAGKILGWRQ